MSRGAVLSLSVLHQLRLSQTKPDGETDEKKGRDRVSPVSPVLLVGRKPRANGLSEEQKQLSPPMSN